MLTVDLEKIVNARIHSGREENILTISIVIGSNETLIVPCVCSIYDGTKTSFDLYIISNIASDETIKNLQNQFKNIKFILNTVRKGFAENHNKIMRMTQSEYILILNDDTLILPGSIDALVNFMESQENQDVGAVSPKLLNDDGTLQPSTYRFMNLFTVFLGLTGIRRIIPNSKNVRSIINFIQKYFRIKGKTRFWDHSHTSEVDTFRGACMLVRREAVKEIGLMDEVSRFMGEETEWHYRFKKKGWKVIYYPFSQIVHYGGESLKRQEKLSVLLEEYKGLLNFYRKHRNYLSYLSLRCMITTIFVFKYTISIVRDRNWKTERSYYHEIFRLMLTPDIFFKNKVGLTDL